VKGGRPVWEVRVGKLTLLVCPTTALSYVEK
jgi:hypothetical protein